MATVSERRVTELAKLTYWKAFEFAEHPANGVLEIASLIEQALLAERRLATEEAAKMVCYYCRIGATLSDDGETHNKNGFNYDCKSVCVRAAAEKEVKSV